MGVLTSSKFTSNDPETNKRLEDCATGNPTEFASHFTIGSPDPIAVRQLQYALALYRGAHLFEKTKDGRSIPPVAINGIYSKEFADAIYIFKDINNIKNYAGKIDNIVGIKTIKALDQAAAKNDPPPSDPIPPIPFDTSKRIDRRVFRKTSTTYAGDNDQSESWSISDLITVATDLQNRIQNPEAILGTEDPVQRRLINVEDSFSVNSVDQTTTMVMTRKGTTGGVVFMMVTTTEFIYKYGPPQPVVIHSITVKENTGGMAPDGSGQKTLFIPREVASKSILLIPPKP